MSYVVETVDAAEIVYRRTNFTLGAYPENVVSQIKTADHVKYPALGLANALTAPEETILRRMVLAYRLEMRVKTTNYEGVSRPAKDQLLINRETAALRYVLSEISEPAKEWLVGPYDDPIKYRHCLLHMAMYDVGINEQRSKDIKQIVREMGSRHANLHPTGKNKKFISDTRSVYAWIGGARQVIAEALQHYNDFDTMWRRGARSNNDMRRIKNKDRAISLVAAGVKKVLEEVHHDCE